MSSPRKGKAPNSLGSLISEIRTLRSHYDQLSELQGPEVDSDSRARKPAVVKHQSKTFQKLQSENAAQEARLQALQTSMDLEGAISASVAPLRTQITVPNTGEIKEFKHQGVSTKPASKELDLTDPFSKCGVHIENGPQACRPSRKGGRESPSFGGRKGGRELHSFRGHVVSQKENKDPGSTAVEKYPVTQSGTKSQCITDVSPESRAEAQSPWANAENLEVTRLPEDLDVTSARPSLLIEEKRTKTHKAQQGTRQTIAMMSCASPSRQSSCIYGAPKVSEEVASRGSSREFSVEASIQHPGACIFLPQKVAAKAVSRELSVEGSAQQPGACVFAPQKVSQVASRGFSREENGLHLGVKEFDQHEPKRQGGHSDRPQSPTNSFGADGPIRRAGPTMPWTPPTRSRTPQTTPRTHLMGGGHAGLDVQRRVTGGLTPRTPHLTPRTSRVNASGQTPQSSVPTRTTSTGHSPRLSGLGYQSTREDGAHYRTLQNGSDGVSPRATPLTTPRSALLCSGHPPQGAGPSSANHVACQSYEPPVVLAFQEHTGPNATQQTTPRRTPRTPMTSDGYPACSAMSTAGPAAQLEGVHRAFTPRVADGVQRSFTPCVSQREQLVNCTGSWMPPQAQPANTQGTPYAQVRQPAVPGPVQMPQGILPVSLVPPQLLQYPSTPQVSQANPWVQPQITRTPHAFNGPYVFTTRSEGTAQTSKNLAAIPLEDRLSFPDASCENLSVIVKDPDHDRIKAMQLATEQATLRQEHAQARRR